MRALRSAKTCQISASTFVFVLRFLTGAGCDADGAGDDGRAVAVGGRRLVIARLDRWHGAAGEVAAQGAAGSGDPAVLLVLGPLHG